jgi:D-alanyl-D-alanine dipeptidase
VIDRSALERALLAIAVFASASCATHPAAPALSRATTMDEAGLVDIRTRVPDIAEDIRYAGNDNFVGAPVDGYRAARCYLLPEAADALASVEHELRTRGLRLLVFDCYRPARAVRHFVRWAQDLSDQHTKARHYPALDKRQLLGDYIAPVSGHSRGATLDLTLLDCSGGHACEPVDMGTQFDFFDPRANTESPLATLAQRQNRQRLRTAMEAAGFSNYSQEWWHYTLALVPAPVLLYDVPIE